MTINDFFNLHPKCAIAYSGGVDSSYLLYLASKYCVDVFAYYVKSVFQPDFELDDAISFADEIGIEMKVISVDILKDNDITTNPNNRCYLCKKLMMSRIKQESQSDGYDVVLDGTNASDDESDRPGIIALRELGILSPLKECGYTKEMIREGLRQANLQLFNKPAYSCLATRIPSLVNITQELLDMTQQAEDMMREMGFLNFRVRYLDGAALVQVNHDQFNLAVEKREEILSKLGLLYDKVLLDMKAR